MRDCLCIVYGICSDLVSHSFARCDGSDKKSHKHRRMYEQTSIEHHSMDHPYHSIQTASKLLVNVPTGSIQDKSFLGTGCLGLPVWHSGGASRSYRNWR